MRRRRFPRQGRRRRIVAPRARSVLPIALVALVALVVGCGPSAGSTGGRATAAPATSATPTAATDSLVSIGAGLRGPKGLTASAYASGVANAAAMAIDAQGRLWVATADYTDAGHDGVFLIGGAGSAPLEVISGLHTALGLAWIDGTLFVASKDRVDAYSGFDGTRFASTRPVVTFASTVGEVNGLAAGPDGRISLGISSACDHCTPTDPHSGSMVSFRPDGTDLRVDGAAIRAPVGLAFYPGTSDLFVTMNQRDDLGAKTPGDWLSVVAPGQSWGFPACYGQGGSACAGVPDPVAVLDRHAAVGSVAIVTGQMGPTVGTAAVVAEWTTGKIQRVALTRVGSTYRGTVSTLITGLKKAVAVAFDPASGALYVADWSTGKVDRITS